MDAVEGDGAPRGWLLERLGSIMLSKVQTPLKGRKDSTFKCLDLLVAFMTLKNPKTVEAKRTIKLEVQSKIFSCTPWQTYSKLFGIYDQQNLQFAVSFIFF